MRRIGMLLVGRSVLITSLAAGSTAIARSKIVVFGDVHGGATELRSLLEALEMIDQSGSWVWQSGCSASASFWTVMGRLLWLLPCACWSLKSPAG